ncbi:MAG: hypothetical protein M1297_10315 [Nitrospirae bacterium]|jgi:hypothetical protein|nr:hypothetical protein [Nitrospirota bacterium]
MTFNLSGKKVVDPIHFPENSAPFSPQGNPGATSGHESDTCGVQSVWELLKTKDLDNTIFIHQSPSTILFLTRDYGAEIGGGIRLFAVLFSGYESAVRWAMESPAIDLDFDRDEFIVRLHPRMLPRKGAWKQDATLLRHSREIAKSLIDIFGLDSRIIWKELQEHSDHSYEGDPFFHRGDLLDTVLLEVRKTINRDPTKMLRLRTHVD